MDRPSLFSYGGKGGLPPTQGHALWGGTEVILSFKRNKSIREVSKRGVEHAIDCCDGLNADTILATVRWFDGKGGNPGLLAWKLKEGGVYVPDEDEAPDPSLVWKSENRLEWMQKFMPDQIELDDGFRAEVAIVGIVRAGLSVSVERVRDFMRGELISEDAV